MHTPTPETVNARPVRILLECILVIIKITRRYSGKMYATHFRCFSSQQREARAGGGSLQVTKRHVASLGYPMSLALAG